jgi:tRNA nucleotidyltransferase (CCA-adding enzyme)
MNRNTTTMKKCGIICYDTDAKKYLLVHGVKSHKWGFPKGHMEKGETEEETALREFREETGIVITDPLKKKIRFRNNVYFLVTMRTMDLPTEIAIQDKNEIEMAKWFSEDDMLRLKIEHCNFGLKNWINQNLLPQPNVPFHSDDFLKTFQTQKMNLSSSMAKDV